MNINDIISAAAAEDVVPSGGGGGFDAVVPAAGGCLLRLSEYLEVGVHPAKNTAHKDKKEVRLTFQIMSKLDGHQVTWEKDGVTHSRPNTVTIFTNIAGPDSAFGRLFKALNIDGDAEFMYQLVGKAYKATLYHVPKDPKDASKGVYVNLDKDRVYSFKAPVKEKLDDLDNVISSTPIDVPEMDGQPRIFLYEKSGVKDDAYKWMFDQLAKKDGSESNTQKKIKSSVGFAKTRLSGLLDGLTVDTPTPTATPTEAPVVDTTEDILDEYGI